MHFLPDVYVPCDICRGRRYNRETLEVLYRGRSIADVLAMSVDEALEFFDAVPSVKRRLGTLSDVGLGYVTLGQPATTLSGGEAQRVKLATELAKTSTGRTIYILDEPTTGLHFEDVRLLLGVLHRLADRGNTIIVIEHHMDVVKTADWVIDMGPEGAREAASSWPPDPGSRGLHPRQPHGRAPLFSPGVTPGTLLPRFGRRCARERRVFSVGYPMGGVWYVDAPMAGFHPLFDPFPTPFGRRPARNPLLFFTCPHGLGWGGVYRKPLQSPPPKTSFQGGVE